MRFSLFIEFQKPGPWDDTVDQQLFRESLEQVVLADRLGWHAVWVAEHHFLPEFSRTPRPDLFLTYCAAKTDQIRLGHGVVVLPINHPLRVAEGIAMLDIMSNGRVEFGTGRGGLTSIESGAFGVDVHVTREIWDEALHIIPKMWSSTVFEHHGKHWDIPQIEVHPKPVQKPHPPMWVAGQQPDTWELAGKRGLGVLGLGGGSPRTLEKLIARYNAGQAEVEPAGGFVTNERAVQVNGICGEDDAETVAFCEAHTRWYYNNAGGAAHMRDWFDRDDIPDSYRWYIENARKGRTMVEHIKNMDAFQLRDGWHNLSGDPEHWIRAVKEYEAVGVDEILVMMQVGKMPHARILESIQLISSEVMPKFSRAPAGAGSR